MGGRVVERAVEAGHRGVGIVDEGRGGGNPVRTLWGEKIVDPTSTTFPLMCGVSSRALRKLILSWSYEQSTIIT